MSIFLDYFPTIAGIASNIYTASTGTASHSHYSYMGNLNVGWYPNSGSANGWLMATLPTSYDLIAIAVRVSIPRLQYTLTGSVSVN